MEPSSGWISEQVHGGETRSASSSSWDYSPPLSVFRHSPAWAKGLTDVKRATDPDMVLTMIAACSNEENTARRSRPCHVRPQHLCGDGILAPSCGPLRRRRPLHRRPFGQQGGYEQDPTPATPGGRVPARLHTSRATKTGRTDRGQNAGVVSVVRSLACSVLNANPSQQRVQGAWLGGPGGRRPADSVRDLRTSLQNKQR
ncbi:unnamed protein product [Gadus morhua 'NCC']